ncbi:hypothetical protein MVEN_00133500 [Mycena venus]|uniref:Uncharacterized protein n=1 Tax=Mycena venus TaxID=2733690 RepID=A0A8H7DIM3_9AGAR|nr:hypothetical protein MVEN_00133500 [Mycena venus]
MSTLPPAKPSPGPLVFQGKLGRLKKKDLQDICRELGMNEKDVKKQKDILLKHVESVLDSNPSLAKDPRFKDLERDKSAGQKAKRTSAAKISEDKSEASKAPKALTGANLKLRNQKDASKVKSNKGGSSPLPDMTESSEEDAQSEVHHQSDEEEQEEHESGGEKGGKEKDIPPSPPHTPPPIVLVSVKHPLQPLLPGEQVYVDNIKIFRSTTADGTVQHEAELTELLPKVIDNNSPIKADRAGRFSRPGVHKPEELMPVGSVAQHLDGSVLPSNLTFGRANRVLLADRGDEYGVTLYFQPSTTGQVPVPVTELTGAKTDKPLEIAKARPRGGQLEVPIRRQEIVTDQFRTFIQQFANNPKFSAKTNLTAGQCLDSYLEASSFLALFKGFKKANLGYYISADFNAPSQVTMQGWEQFRHCSFTQIILLKAGGLGNSSTRDNLKLFKRAKEIGGDIGKWVKAERPDPDAEDADSDDFDSDDSDAPKKSPYESMKRKDFVEIVDVLWKEREDQKPVPFKGHSSSKSKSKKSGASSSKRDAGSSKHASSSKRDTSGSKHASSSKLKKRGHMGDSDDQGGNGDGSEEEERPKKKAKGKKKMTSDDMDGSATGYES